MKSDIILDLIKVIGCGVEAKQLKTKGVSPFNLDALRWDKIIICTDADEDGYQIRTLILTMFYRLLPTLIREGRIYIAETPLYEITCGLDGFVVNWEVTDDLVYNVTYLNEPYIVDFKQSVKSEYDTNWNTEDTSIETIMIDEYEAVYFLDNHNYHHLVWNTEDYVFSVSTNVGKDELIEMSKSVQKVE
jgi:DNA gyrase/topoisomerase IV subunit B